MAQQINLFTPALPTQSQHFSARSMAWSMLALVACLAILAGWGAFATARLRAQTASATMAYEAEKRHLTAAAAARPSAHGDDSAIGQELAQAERLLAERRRALDDAGAAGDSPQRRSALLRWIAETVPASVWLTQVRIGKAAFGVSGQTLQPEALRSWIQQLSEHPALAADRKHALSVERNESAAGTRSESWAFEWSGRQPEAASP